MEAEVTSVGRTIGCKRGNRHNSWCDKYRVLCSHYVPGPILGAIIGVVILGLGVAKGIETLQAGRSKTRGAARLPFN